jgi:integrase
MTSRLVSGFVFHRRGVRGDVWYAKYRLPDGRQIKRRIGPAWTERAQPAEGYVSRRTARAWLEEILAQATFGTQVIGNPRVSILQVKEWMGHADIDTTMKYLHYAPRAGDADLIAKAFASASDPLTSRNLEPTESTE